jgi:hypothetical protein
MRKHQIKSLVTTIFLIWLFASIGLAIYLSAHDRIDLVLMIVGQYFLIFSLYIFSIDNEKSILFALCHLTLGVCLLIVPWFLKVLPVFTDLSGIKLYEIIGIFVLLVFGYLFIILSREKTGKQFTTLMGTSIVSFILILLLSLSFCF